MPYIHPQSREDGIFPLESLDPEHRATIERLIAGDKPPARWLYFDGGRMESRAWWEWHWTRGKKLRYVEPDGIVRRKIPKATRAQVIARDGLICGICSAQVDPTVVHGGTNDPENLQVAHSRCNIRKGARV